jgi:prevent-host-death family protein
LVKQINVQEAKTHLSRLLEEAVAGEDIVIAKAGRPYVRLTPVVPERAPRVFGQLRGKIQIAADFDETPPEVVASFEGRPRGRRRR